MTAASKPRARIASADEIAADRAAALRLADAARHKAAVADLETHGITGRDEPRLPAALGHDVQFGPVTLCCAGCGWILSLREPHSLAFLTRVLREHETGEPS